MQTLQSKIRAISLLLIFMLGVLKLQAKEATLHATMAIKKSDARNRFGE